MEKKPDRGLKKTFWTPERKFALFFGMGMALLAAFTYWKNGPRWLLLTAAVLGVYHFTFGIAFPKMTLPFSAVTRFIGNVVTVILFALVYYLLFTPISIILRLAGKDVIRDQDRKSGWIYYTEKQNDPSRLDKLY